MLYLIRRTFGFNRDRDRVSLSQFCEGIVRADGRRLDHGTGMQHRHVTAALVSLEEKGLVRKIGGGRGRGKAPTYVLPIAEESGEQP